MDPCRTSYGKVVKLLFLTACRRVEIGCLKWSEVDLDKTMLVIPSARNQPSPSGASLLDRCRDDVVFGMGRFDTAITAMAANRGFPIVLSLWCFLESATTAANNVRSGGVFKPHPKREPAKPGPRQTCASSCGMGPAQENRASAHPRFSQGPEAI